MGKAKPIYPDGLELWSPREAFRTAAACRRPIRRSVPISRRWARFALCIFPDRRSPEIFME